MKRVIKASVFDGEPDLPMEELFAEDDSWVDDLAKEISSYSKSVIAELGESKYYKAKIKEISEDRYGYPVVVIGIYNGARCINEIDVGTFYGDSTDPITTLDDDTKGYIKDEIQECLGY